MPTDAPPALAPHDPLWGALTHAYGAADDVPALLASVGDAPGSATAEDEPFSALWSRLCHQGDVYDASYAAVPHLVGACRCQGGEAVAEPLSLVAAIETARLRGRGPRVPARLAGSYDAALASVPDAVAAVLTRPAGFRVVSSALCAIASASGQAELADAVFELDEDTLPRFLEGAGDQ